MATRKTAKPEAVPGWVYMSMRDDFGCLIKLGKYRSQNVFEDFEFYMRRGMQCSLDNDGAKDVIMHVQM